MKVTVKLLPPYVKPGGTGEVPLVLPAAEAEEPWDLRRLAGYLAREKEDLLAFPLVDAQGVLTAEFMVNGRSASADTLLQEGDVVTVIPYICGG